MELKAAYFKVKNLAGTIDWKLLLFLILFLDVKLAVKVLALVIIYLLRFDFKFGFRVKNSRLPLFYLLVIGIAVFNGLVYKSYSNIRYDVVFAMGIGLWLMCILAIHQIKLAVERDTVEMLHRTLLAFFLLNALCSVFNLVHIIWETKALNPYLYQGMRQRYFISTGDYIKGLTFDVSITNSILNAVGVIYFVFRKNYGMLLLCMAVLLLTGSNTLNLLTFLLLALIFIFSSNRDQKSFIAICVVFFMVFTIKVSPQNSDYVIHSSERIFGKNSHQPIFTDPFLGPEHPKPDSLLTPAERKEKIARHYLDSESAVIAMRHRVLNKPQAMVSQRLAIPKPNLNDMPYQEAGDTSMLRANLIRYIKSHEDSLPLSGQNRNTHNVPGKGVALLQTVAFIAHQPLKILTGDGLGNFSSKIAFKATNLGFAGGFPQKYVYINRDFMVHHLDVYLNFFSKNIGQHSVINSPNSVYLQLLGEYGLIGIAAFVVFYLGYFLKHRKALTYGLPIMLLVLCVFFLEYWFEQLSVVVLVELLLLLNIKEAQVKGAVA